MLEATSAPQERIRSADAILHPSSVWTAIGSWRSWLLSSDLRSDSRVAFDRTVKATVPRCDSSNAIEQRRCRLAAGKLSGACSFSVKSGCELGGLWRGYTLA